VKPSRRHWRLAFCAAVSIIAALGAISYLKYDFKAGDFKTGDSKTRGAQFASAADASGSEGGSGLDDTVGGSRESASSPTSLRSLEQSSLRGAEVDGAIVFGPNGDVSVDMGLRRLFDYYLSLVGERDISQIRQLLEAHVSSRYGAEKVASVLAYFDRYTTYLKALSDSNLGGLSDPQQRLDNVKALRRSILGLPMALAFFGEEEALAELTLKRIAVASDQALSVAERTKRLAELDASSGYTARTDAGTASVVADQERRFDEMKLTDRQRAREREALWGKDAAVRLEQLDRDTAQWDSRVERYLAARARIDANAGMSSAARAQAVAALRAQQFNATEQRRIASLEAIGQLKPGG
jgi:lipase chaperone LimK